MKLLIFTKNLFEMKRDKLFKEKPLVLYSHNGWKFDNWLMIKHSPVIDIYSTIANGNDINKVVINTGHGEIHLKDSRKFLNFSIKCIIYLLTSRKKN